jgi:site-specific recombinase XerD
LPGCTVHRAAIRGKWFQNTFRHTYSTLLSEHGDDVKVVQELMRHAKLSTTMEIYTHLRIWSFGRM